MHEQINEKTVALTSRGVRLTGHMLAKMMQEYLRYRQRVKSKTQTNPPKPGRRSLNSLKRDGASIADIEISGDNIGAVKRVARQHNIDFSLKRDNSANPPKWIVFFKSKNDKAIMRSIQEFLGSDKQNRTKTVKKDWVMD